MRRIAIVGSRHADRDAVRLDLGRLLRGWPCIIVTGGGGGTDLAAMDYAMSRDWQVEVYKADWKKYGKGFV